VKRTGFWIVLTLVAAAAGLGLSYRPWKAYMDQRELTREQQRQMDEAEARRAELARELARLQNQSGREGLARDHGYVRKNEQTVEPSSK
jgi:cell division protein FtsB